MQWILADDGKPFQTREAALSKQRLLRLEFGSNTQLEVQEHPEGGYGLMCTNLSQSARPTREIGPAATVPVPSPPPQGYAPIFALRPAVRAFWPQQAKMVVGLLLLFSPQWLLTPLYQLVPPNGPLWALVQVGLVVVGLTYVVPSALQLLWRYFGSCYFIDVEGVTQVRWYFRRGLPHRQSSRVNFTALRTVDVEQSLIEALLNLGTVKLAAGGTDTYEVVLSHVSKPHRLRAEFQERQRARPLATDRQGISHVA